MEEKQRLMSLLKEKENMLKVESEKKVLVQNDYDAKLKILEELEDSVAREKEEKEKMIMDLDVKDSKLESIFSIPTQTVSQSKNSKSRKIIDIDDEENNVIDADEATYFKNRSVIIKGTGVVLNVNNVDTGHMVELPRSLQNDVINPTRIDDGYRSEADLAMAGVTLSLVQLLSLRWKGVRDESLSIGTFLRAAGLTRVEESKDQGIQLYFADTDRFCRALYDKCAGESKSLRKIQLGLPQRTQIKPRSISGKYCLIVNGNDSNEVIANFSYYGVTRVQRLQSRTDCLRVHLSELSDLLRSFGDPILEKKYLHPENTLTRTGTHTLTRL